MILLVLHIPTFIFFHPNLYKILNFLDVITFYVMAYTLHLRFNDLMDML